MTAAPRPRILNVDDDEANRYAVSRMLQGAGFEPIEAGTGTEALERARERPDAVLLDLRLPDLDGFEVCRRLKNPRGGMPGVPIIMLSARGAELDRVRGLELGADDYVTKPFSLMELLARVAAVLRRGARSAAEPEALEFGDVKIDFVRQTASKAGRPLELPVRAFAILKVFARRPGEVVSRDVLLDEAWGYEKYPNTRTVDNHLVKLRKALEDEPERPRYLVTVHGAGYRLDPDGR